MIIQWSADPIAFSIGSMTFRWYGILYILVFYMGYYIVEKICKTEKQSTDFMDGATASVLFFSTVFARLFHCFFYDWNYYSSNPLEIFAIHKGGLASHGGALGIFIGLFVYTKINKNISLFWITDRIAFPAAIAAAMIRFGNFMNSENYGIATNSDWGVVFTNVDKFPRHPTQLYESISYLLIGIGGYFIYQKFKGKSAPGLLLGFSLGMVFLVRIFVEFVKVTQETTPTGLPLNMGQLLSIPTVLISFYFFIKGWNKSK